MIGDCLYLFKDICKFVLDSYFEKGVEYLNGIGVVIGMNVEIMNFLCLKEIKKYFFRVDYLEYMIWYF